MAGKLFLENNYKINLD